jgi:DNA-3-methyladenine glycosylase
LYGYDDLFKQALSYFTFVSNIVNLPLNYSILAPAFYQGDDVVKIARSLLGKLLVSQIDGRLTAGRIVETEAYNGIIDKASHAFGNRRTARTEVMYGEGGHAYVYLCYGIHHLFNVVTNVAGVPHAVLVRAIEPVVGKEIMLERSGKAAWSTGIGSGPGNVSKALGIQKVHNGEWLWGDVVFIADDGRGFKETEIIATPRIGVEYAAEDASLLYRFVINGHPNISAKRFTSNYTDA